MLVKNIKEIWGTERDVGFDCVDFRSLRFLIASDGMGFSVHKTLIPKGLSEVWHYKNHLESCYCVSGLAKLEDLETGLTHIISPDTLYALDKHDKHRFTALEDTVLISVFNPPVNGNETHREDGSYE